MLRNNTAFPLSYAQLDQQLGNERPKNILNFLAARSVMYEKYDFTVKALDTTNVWTVASGATATGWTVRAEAGGWIRGVLGTTIATSGLQLSIPQKYWTGTSTAGVAFLWRSDVVQGVQYEMGFADALPAVNTTVVNNSTSPSFNTAVDVAAFAYIHAGNATAVPDRVGLYVNNSSAATAQKAVYTIPTLGATPGPAANTEHFVAIEIQGSAVSCWIGDQSDPVVLSSAITAANGLIPFFSAKSTNSTSKNIDLDAIFTWSGRLG